MKDVLQLTDTRRAPILKSMPDTAKKEGDEVRLPTGETGDDKEKKKRQGKSTSREETSEQRERRVRVAENDARRTLERYKPQEGKKPQKDLHEMSPDELYEEYHKFLSLEKKLIGTSTDLGKQIAVQKEAIAKELQIYGLDPAQEFEVLSEVPVTYSATLLNNLTEPTLGIRIEGDSKKGVWVGENGTIHVPGGDLSLEDTLRVANELMRGVNAEKLKGKESELVAFGSKIRELAMYLAGQKDKGENALFSSEEEQNAIRNLYNAGVWLSGLGGTTTENIGGKTKSISPIQEWEELEDKGREFTAKLSKDDEVSLLQFLWGKNPFGGKNQTTYTKLLESPRFHGSEELLREFLKTKGSLMIRMITPHIIESYSKGGKAMGNMARGLQQAIPTAVFEATRAKTREKVTLPSGVQQYLKETYGISFEKIETELVVMAKRLQESDVFKRMPLEQQLEALNRMVQSYGSTGETTGETVKGYELATVFDNAEVELGCSVRAYLLAHVIDAAYASGDGKKPIAVANTMLLPSRSHDGVIGHSRLMVTSSTGDGVYIVDPTIQVNLKSKAPVRGEMTGIQLIQDKDLADSVREVAKTGTSRNVTIPGEKGVSAHQTLGDAYESQESNIIANVAAAGGSDSPHRVQMLQLALQKDPNNQMALLHLAAITKDPETKEVLKERLQRLNPELKGKELDAMLSSGKNPEKFQVAYISSSIQDQGLKDFIENIFGKENFNSSTFHTMFLRGQAMNLRQIQQELLRRLPSLTDQRDINFVNGIAQEIEALISKESVQNHIQKELQQIESDPAQPTGFSNLQGSYQQTQQLTKFINDLDPSLWGATPQAIDEGREFIANLRAELHVRTAGHDISFLGRQKGAGGVQEMVEAGNRFATEEYLEVESLPGVALVRRLYEQEASHFVAEHGGIGPSDFQTIQTTVEHRFKELRRSGVIKGLSDMDISTVTELERLQIERASTVGRNIFIIKTRLAHFIALGDPVASAPELAIGNSPWDFLAQIYSPYKWMMGRYGLVTEQGKVIVELLGRDKIDKILALEDHDSSVWRIPAFIKEFDDAGLSRQALFMRMYRTGYTKDMVERGRVLQDIIMYTPEELANILKNFQEGNAHDVIHHILSNLHYEEFLTAIIWAREKCIVEGDFEYNNFHSYLRSKGAEVTQIYQELTTFLHGFATNFDLTDFGRKFTVKHDGEKAEKFINPLFGDRNRVPSLADAPFELIDKKVKLDANGKPELVSGRITQEEKYNEDLFNVLGGQDVGREWTMVSDASKGSGAILKVLRTPSFDSLKELHGQFLYRGAEFEERVILEMAKGLFQFVGEHPALRVLMPGIDRLIGRVAGGGSLAQQKLGPLAESLDTAEMEGQIKHLLAEGLLTPEGAKQIRHLMRLSLVFRGIPLLQIVIAIVIASIFKTAFDQKALLAA